MSKKRRGFDVALVIFCLVLWLSTGAKPLYAYADPGTGLMTIQILGATFAGFLFLIRKRIFELTTRIRRLMGKNRQSPDSPAALPPHE